MCASTPVPFTLRSVSGAGGTGTNAGPLAIAIALIKSVLAGLGVLFHS